MRSSDRALKALRSIGVAVVGAASAALLAVPYPVSAQVFVSRAWVASNGDDANPCSRTAPCKTFRGAMARLNPNGEINCVDSGSFGAVEITLPIVIDCKGVSAHVVNASNQGVIVDAPGSKVILRNLNINGAGGGSVGIRILRAFNVHIEDVNVHGQTNSGIEVVPTAPNFYGDAHVSLVRVVSRDNGQHGVLVAPASACACGAQVAVLESVFAGNALTGIRVNDRGLASVARSMLTGNGTHGAAAVASGSLSAIVVLEGVTSSFNLNGGVLASGLGGYVFLSNVVLTGNAYGVYPPIGGATYWSFENNRARGNTIADVPSGTFALPKF
jgi:hypothetical protein